MLLSSAVWILITAPIVGTLNILILYAPAIIFLAAAAVMSLREQEPENQTL
jgi:NADH:ubiquinone oxidoreductase subunit 6 (subunit J)